MRENNQKKKTDLGAELHYSATLAFVEISARTTTKKFLGSLVSGSRNAAWERLSLCREHREQSGADLTIPTK